MLQGEDVVILLKLAALEAGWTIRSVADDVGIARSVVHRSIGRLEAAGLTLAGGRRVNAVAAVEFLVHGVRYVFPPQFGGAARGVPTAWAAEPLAKEFVADGEEPPVWPDPLGTARGVALAPLHRVAPALSRSDPVLAGSLALVDGLRVGDARMRGVAAKLLEERLMTTRPVL
jgi:hypothetical protein